MADWTHLSDSYLRLYHFDQPHVAAVFAFTLEVESNEEYIALMSALDWCRNEFGPGGWAYKTDLIFYDKITWLHDNHYVFMKDLNQAMMFKVRWC